MLSGCRAAQWLSCLLAAQLGNTGNGPGRSLCEGLPPKPFSATCSPIMDIIEGADNGNHHDHDDDDGDDDDDHDNDVVACWSKWELGIC